MTQTYGVGNAMVALISKEPQIPEIIFILLRSSGIRLRVSVIQIFSTGKVPSYFLGGDARRLVLGELSPISMPCPSFYCQDE